MFNENTKEKVGKILFVVSIFVFILMLFSPLNNLLFSVDEYFTLGLIKFPMLQAVTITAHDVHPPFYYILLKIAIKLFSGFDIVVISKIVTLMPYFIMLLVSATKIQKDYNWLTAGLLTFSLFSMCEFFMFYLTIRMYSWAVLFLLLSFVFLKDVIDKSDVRSWFLLTLFVLLGAYTHYFVAISSMILYCILLIYFIFNNKSEIKKWLISAVCIIIGYCPWLFVLFNQLNKVHENYWIPQITPEYLLQGFTYFYSTNASYTLLALIFLIFSFAVFILEYSNKDKMENEYILLGMSLFILTIIVGVILSLLFKPILRVRYLMPAVGVFWFSISILIGKLENNKLLIVSLVFFLILGALGSYSLIGLNNDLYQTGISNQNVFDEMNDNSTVICIGAGETLQFGTYLNESKVYMDTKSVYGVGGKDVKKLFDIKYTSNINKTIDKHSDGNIYIIIGSWRESDLINDTNLIHSIGENNFYKYR